MLLEKRTLFSKIPAVSALESKSSAAGPNFGRGFSSATAQPLGSIVQTLSNQQIKRAQCKQTKSKQNYFNFQEIKVRTQIESRFETQET